MLGILYLLLAICTGYNFILYLLPSLFEFTKKTYTRHTLNAPSIMLIFPASLLTGVLLLSWPTYIIAYWCKSAKDPLTIADIIVIILAVLLNAAAIWFKRQDSLNNFKKLIVNIHPCEIGVILFTLILAAFMMIRVFYYSDETLHISKIVYGDFATHLDMIRSFSHGNNFPTSYSHYAGADIRYHFMYQFFIGNLEHLGLRLDIAFLIPSILFFTSVCMLLYLYAIKLFRKRLIGVLTVVFFLFRSSTSFFKYVGSLTGTFAERWDAFINNTDYIGYTTNENWGIYSLNVYPNQRHLPLGLCMIILAVMLFTPHLFSLFQHIQNRGFVESLKRIFACKAAWMPKDYITPVVLGFIIGLTGFFNGACVIACLLILCVIAIMSDRKLEFAITALISVILTVAQAKFFIDGSTVDFKWEPGYIAEVKTFFGVIVFIASLLGAFCVTIVVAAVLTKGPYRWLILAFVAPIIFAFIANLTVDVAVNHKYILIGCMLCDIFVAFVVAYLFSSKDRLVKTIAVVLTVILTITGVYELLLFYNKNKDHNYYVDIDTTDPVYQWILTNTDARDIFLTDKYSCNKETVAGAMLYYGWPYSAWSAGYDMHYRYEQRNAMFEADNSAELIDLCRNNNIRYILIDRGARFSEEFEVNEEVIADTFECVFSYGDPGWEENIYDTTRVISH